MRRRIVPLLPEPVRRIGRSMLRRPYVPPRPARISYSWERPREELLDPAWHEQPHFQKSQELIVAYVSRMLPDRGRLRILDAPCGNGRLYRGLERAGIASRVEYVGLDITAGLIEASRQLVPAGRFLEGSVEAIPLPDQAFDIVVAQHILRHLESYEAAVAEMIRVCSGVVLVAEKEISESGDELGTAYDPGNRMHIWVNKWEPSKLKRFAREHGACLAFTLNDARHDDPDAQFVFAFHR